jgi:hypothetical protein
LRFAPLRLPPYRFTGIGDPVTFTYDDGGGPVEYTNYSYVFEPYSWEGRVIHGSDLGAVPVFWTPHTLATALGVTVEEIADEAIYMPARLLDPAYALTRVPRMLFTERLSSSALATIRDGLEAKGIAVWDHRDLRGGDGLGTLRFPFDLTRFCLPHDGAEQIVEPSFSPTLSRRKFLGGQVLIIKGQSFGLGDYDSVGAILDAAVDSSINTLRTYINLFDRLGLVKLIDEDPFHDPLNEIYVQGYEQVINGVASPDFKIYREENFVSNDDFDEHTVAEARAFFDI